MDEKFKSKIEKYLKNRLEQISIELDEEDEYLHHNVEIVYSKLEAKLNDEQRKLLFEYEFNNNLRTSAENEQYYRLGFLDGMQFFQNEQ